MTKTTDLNYDDIHFLESKSVCFMCVNGSHFLSEVHRRVAFPVKNGAAKVMKNNEIFTASIFAWFTSLLI